jgi:hypothetical protein
MDAFTDAFADDFEDDFAAGLLTAAFLAFAAFAVLPSAGLLALLMLSPLMLSRRALR